MDLRIILLLRALAVVAPRIVFEDPPLCSDPISKCVLFSNCLDEDSEMNQICGFRHQQSLVCCRDFLSPTAESSTTTTTKPESSKSDTKLSTDCGKTSTVFFNRIIGGEPVEAQMWPWLVVLYIKNAPECGGSFISQNWVLTASHCLFSDSAGKDLIRADEVKVRMGVSNLTSPARFRSVSDVVPHPEYGGARNYANDIGLLKLVTEVKPQDQVKAICLPGSTNDQADPTRQDTTNRMAFVAGWGRTNQESRKGSDVLLQTQVMVWSRSDCLSAYSKIFNMTDTSFCAGIKEGGKDACQGDSGGPLMLPGLKNDQDRFYAVGIVSFGYGCGKTDFPGGYANTTLYRTWIEEKMLSLG